MGSARVGVVDEASSRRTATVTLCFLTAALEGFDIQAIGVAAPRLVPEFGLTPDEAGWIFAISNVGLVLGASVGGWLADRLGRKPVLIGALLTFGLFTLLTSLAPGFEPLMIVRLVAGLGFGAAIPNMMAMANEVSTPQQRAATTAAMFCGMPVGGSCVSLLTQVLPAGLDWRALFVVGGVLPLVLAPALYRWLPETWRARELHERTRLALAHVLFGEGRAAPTVLAALALLPTVLILYVILNWLPSLVVANGLSAQIAPQASLAFNLVSIPGSILIGALVDRRGARWPLTLSYAALIATLFALGAARDHATILVLSGAVGFLLLGANYSLYAVVASCYPQRMRGTGTGAVVAFGRVGSILGPVAAGAMLGSGASATTVLQYLAPLAALASVAAFSLSLFSPRE